MKRFIIGLAFVSIIAVAAVPVVSTVSVSAAVSAQQTITETIEIPVNTVVRGAKGSEHQLATHSVANGEYKLTVEAVNQDSEHPNTDIIVRSGQSILSVTDVEHRAFEKKTAEGTLVVANGEVKVYVKLGADKVFSGGVKVILAIVPPITPPPAPQPPAPTNVLPATGPADVATIVTVSTISGYLGHLFLRRRQ